MSRILVTYLLLLFLMPVLAQKRDFLPDTISLCYGDSAFVEIREQLDKNTTVTWTTPMGIVTNTKRLAATKTGKYYVRVASVGMVHSDSCFVKYYYKVKKTLKDTVICKGRSIMLDAKNPGVRYLWNTGEVTQKIQVESPGRYWVKLRNGSCVTTDSVRVRQAGSAVITVPQEVMFCAGDEHKAISIKAPPLTRVLWSTGVTTNSTAINKEGTYWVRTENGNCGSQVDSVRVKVKPCECEMVIPNSFTPNEDNRNDYFFPVSTCDYSYFYITITDRWGNTVYSSSNLNGKWDGRFKGNLCPEDIYIYRIESTERGGDKKAVRTGRISLFR